MATKNIVTSHATKMGSKVSISSERPNSVRHNSMKTMPAGVPSKTSPKQ